MALSRFVLVAAVGCGMVLAACGGGAAPAASSAPASAASSPATVASPSSAPASTAAKPSGSAPASAAPSKVASASASASASPSAASSAEASAAGGKLIISYSELVSTNLPLWAADSAGIFKKEGLNVQTRLIQSSLGVGALTGNEVQFALMGGSETLAADVSGAHLVVLATISPVYPYQFVVPASIKTAKDLIGKKVGVSHIGSSSDVATRVGLERVGINPSKDVTIVQLGSLPARTAALFNGAIQGAVDLLPDTYTLEQHGFHSLFDMAKLKLPTANDTLVARRSWIAAHHAIAQKVVDAMIQGIARVKQDKALSLSLMGKHFKHKSSSKALDETYTYVTQNLFPNLPTPEPVQFKAALTQLIKKNAKAKGFNVSSILDPSFVQDAAKRGLGKG